MLASRERAAGSHVIELAPEDYSYELLSSTMAAVENFRVHPMFRSYLGITHPRRRQPAGRPGP